MICLTREDFRKSIVKWSSGVFLDETFYPYCEGKDANCFVSDIPSKGSSLPVFARILTLLEAEDETYFHGAFLSFSLWDIGSPQLDKIGWAVVERMRLAYGEPRPLEVAPVQRFRDDESTQAQAFLLQPLIFQWDANLVHNTFDRFAHVSHDGYVVIGTATKEAYESCRLLLEPWNPRDPSDQLRALFCRPGVGAAS